MKNEATKSGKTVIVSEDELLSFVAFALKDKELFPRKVEDAKKFLKGVKLPKSFNQ